MSLFLHPKVDLPHSFVLINVPNKDGAAFVIYKGFNPISDMGRSIDSGIFVMPRGVRCH